MVYPLALVVAFAVHSLTWNHLPFVSAVRVNITIDDTLGDPVTGARFAYFPATQWSTPQDSLGNCTSNVCLNMLNQSKAFDGTWHGAMYTPTTDLSPQSATVSFFGSAIYVYCILVSPQLVQDVTPHLWFEIDGVLTADLLIPTNDPYPTVYDRLVYANESLPWGFHTFSLVNGAPDNQSLIVLDYIMYTAETESSSVAVAIPTTTGSAPAATVTVWMNKPTAQTRTIAIAVSIVGVAILGALWAFAVWLRRYNRKFTPSIGFQNSLSGEGQATRIPRTWEDSTFDPASVRPFLTRSSSDVWRKLSPPIHETPVPVSEMVVHISRVASFVEPSGETSHADEDKYCTLDAVPIVDVPVSNDARGTLKAPRPVRYTGSHPQLVVKIPKRELPALPVSTASSSPSLPPLPCDESPSEQGRPPKRPTSDGAVKRSPPSARRRVLSVVTMRSRLSNSTTNAGTARGSGAYGSNSERATTAGYSTMTTPTSTILPAGFYIPSPSYPALPARADSVRTLKLSPNRHPDMEIPPVPSPVRGLSEERVDLAASAPHTAEDDRSSKHRKRFGRIKSDWLSSSGASSTTSSAYSA